MTVEDRAKHVDRYALLRAARQVIVISEQLSSANDSWYETEPQAIQRVLRQRRVHGFPD